MLKALGGTVLINYIDPDTTFMRESGVVVLSEQFRRYRLKGKSRIIDVFKPLDVIRFGEVISSGVIWIAEGRIVAFNRHDAWEFQYDDKIYYKIRGEHILGYAD